jgi:signal transduction histidine kinase
MHGILSFARFGQQKFETAPKEKLKMYFDDIYGSAQRLMVLLNDLLDFSKLDAGKIDFSMMEADITVVAGSVANEMRAFAEEKSVKVDVVYTQRPVLLTMDPSRMSQVLRNLISNAIKFSHPQSQVLVLVEEIADEVIIQVINRGIGIPPGELETIFDEFVQSSKTKSGAGGTGLGLAICKKIVAGHGGAIHAECDAEGETRFVAKLPRQSAKPATAS